MMQQCPKFNICSATFCPLDPDNKIRVVLKGDKKCTASKKDRLKLGKDLDTKGLTPYEARSQKGWEKRSEESRQNTLSRMAKLGAKSRFAYRVEK